MAPGCSVGHKMWLRSSVAEAVAPAIAPIQPLSQELPYAVGVALEKAERQKKNK